MTGTDRGYARTVTVRSGSIDFFGSVKRMITGQDALMWLAVTAAVGAVCLVWCRAGRMKKRTAVLTVLLGFYLAVFGKCFLVHPQLAVSPVPSQYDFRP